LCRNGHLLRHRLSVLYRAVSHGRDLQGAAKAVKGKRCLLQLVPTPKDPFSLARAASPAADGSWRRPWGFRQPMQACDRGARRCGLARSRRGGGGGAGGERGRRTFFIRFSNLVFEFSWPSRAQNILHLALEIHEAASLCFGALVWGAGVCCCSLGMREGARSARRRRRRPTSLRPRGVVGAFGGRGLGAAGEGSAAAVARVFG
jgi:hypothetical protein